jgi:VWFA-related protein
MALFILALLTGCGGGGGSSGGSSSPTSTSAQISTDSSLNLGVAVVGSSSSRQLTIKNTGSANLVIGQISLANSSSSFSIPSKTDNCSGKTLAPSAQATLQIQLSPSAQTDYTNTLTIPSNDSSHNPFRVSLTGEGRALGVQIDQVIVNSSTGVMDVYVSVVDSNGAPVTNLSTSTQNPVFSISENGVQQTITSITQPAAATSPISVALVLDYSGSIPAADNTTMQGAAKTFIDNLLTLNSGNEAAIVKFATNIGLQQNFTSNQTLLDTAIDATYPGDTSDTLIFDTVFTTIDYTAANAPNSLKAIILFSDGEDYSPVHTLQDVINEAIVKNIPIYTIIYLDAQDPKPGIMQEMAQETGGQYLSINAVSQLTDIFTQITQVLGNQYLLEYHTSSSVGASLSLDVEINNNGNLGGTSKVVTSM